MFRLLLVPTYLPTYLSCWPACRHVPFHHIASHNITSRLGLICPPPTQQTSLSESGQSKALIVLDADTWEEKAVIPLDIGRRFFRVKGEHEPLPTLGEVRRRYVRYDTSK